MSYIGKELKRFNLPEWLIWLPLLESGYRSQAVSPAGAVGLWQLMPDTARRFGLVVSATQDDRYDVSKSTQAALRYLAWLQMHFNGDWALVLAAYNAGENTIDTAQHKAKLDDYCDLMLPEETQHYVPRFIAMATLLRNSRASFPTGSVPQFMKPQTIDLSARPELVRASRSVSPDRWVIPKTQGLDLMGKGDALRLLSQHPPLINLTQ